MIKKILFFTVLCIHSFYCNAETNYKVVHKQNQQKLFGTLDYCSNIASKEIFSIGSEDLVKINKDFQQIKKNFKEYKTQKEQCFNQASSILNDIIADNLIQQQTDDSIYIDLQNKIDMGFADAIKLRKKINSALLESIISDIELSIEKNKEALKNIKNKASNLFVKESGKTQELVKQELNIIYDSMQKQLNLEQHFLNLEEKPTAAQIAELSLKDSFIKVNRAMLLFENIEKGSKAYHLAKIRTFIHNAHNKLLELKSFSPKLEGLDSKKEINKVIDQLSIISVDLNVTIKDLTEDSFSDDFFSWAGQVYQTCGEISNQLQKILDTIYLINLTADIDVKLKEESEDTKKILNLELDQQAPEEQPSGHKKQESKKAKE